MNDINSVQCVRAELISLSDQKYREFSSALIPGCGEMLGVRIPEIRKIAIRIAKDDPAAYLDTDEEQFFEETMLKGLIIGKMNCDIDTVLECARQFIPKITNWSVCDSFCAGMKIVAANRERVWSFLKPYIGSDRPYDIRMALVMYLDYFVTDDYIYELFGIFDDIKSDDYYVKTAAAWAVSVCFVKFPERTLEYLKKAALDDETYGRALQKISESYRVSPENKALIRSMRGLRKAD